MKKFISVLCVFLITLFAVSGCASSTSNESNEIENIERTFTVETILPDGQKTTQSETTVDIYLGEYLRDKGIVNGDQTDSTFKVTEVNGNQAADNQKWVLSVDGKETDQDINGIKIENGAVYSFTLTNN